MSKKENWVWMPHSGHLIVGHQCQFHLATYVGGGYLVSTVGEWWPDRSTREIHASIFDPAWHTENNHLMGDYYDDAYMKHFGFEEIGHGRKYETMVFKAVRNVSGQCKACPWVIRSGSSEVGGTRGYNDPGEAYRGHLELCEEWSKK